MISRPSRNGSGSAPRVGDRHGDVALAVADPEVWVVPSLRIEPGCNLAGQLVGLARLRGGRAAGTDERASVEAEKLV